MDKSPKLSKTYHNVPKLQISENLVYFCGGTHENYPDMKQDSFPFLLDLIFAGLSDIKCLVNEQDRDKSENYLNSICAEIVVQVVAEQKSLNQPEREIFVKMATDRVRMLAALSFQDSKFEAIWQKALSDLEEKLHTFLCILLMSSLGQSQASVSEGRIAFPPGTTVAYLAAHTRVAYECGMFLNQNKTELCRQVAAVCCTPYQQIISPNSFKNFFIDPSEEVLSLVERDLEVKSKITKKMKAVKIRKEGELKNQDIECQNTEI